MCTLPGLDGKDSFVAPRNRFTDLMELSGDEQGDFMWDVKAACVAGASYIFEVML